MTKRAILNKFQNLPADIQQQALDYMQFLLEKYEGRTSKKNKIKENETVIEYAEKDIPERLRIAMQFEGAAPYPDISISKYDCYEQ